MFTAAKSELERRRKSFTDQQPRQERSVAQGLYHGLVNLPNLDIPPLMVTQYGGPNSGTHMRLPWIKIII